MFESIAVGSIKTLLDIIILVKDKIIPTQRGHAFNFERVIEPIFTSLQPVVDDYFMFFRQALTELQIASTDDKINEVVFRLKTDREKMLTTRIAIRAAAQELIKKSSDDQYVAFFIAIENLLAPANQDTDNHYSISQRLARNARLSPSLGMSIIISDKNTNYSDVKSHRDDLSKMVNDAISNLESSWVEVAHAYASLRFEYLKRARM